MNVDELTARIADQTERRLRLLEQARKQRRRDETFVALGSVIIALASIGYAFRGETAFRTSVVMLLTVIAVMETRRR